MSSYFDNYYQNSATHDAQGKGLLSTGWRPLHREFDWEYFTNLLLNDPLSFTQKTLDLASDVADSLGRTQYAWWANIFNVFSESMRYEFDEFWDYITPATLLPDYRCQDILSVETPVTQLVSRESIPIDYVLNRLQEITVLKVLEILGKPNLITQTFMERFFYYPVE